MAAREAEMHANEAAQRRAWREAPSARKVVRPIGVRLAAPPRTVVLHEERADDFSDARLKEIEERERALADREKLIASLETLLDRSRRRLEERLAQLDQRIAVLTPTRI